MNQLILGEYLEVKIEIEYMIFKMFNLVYTFSIPFSLIFFRIRFAVNI